MLNPVTLGELRARLEEYPDDAEIDLVGDFMQGAQLWVNGKAILDDTLGFGKGDSFYV